MTREQIAQTVDEIFPSNIHVMANVGEFVRISVKERMGYGDDFDRSVSLRRATDHARKMIHARGENSHRFVRLLDSLSSRMAEGQEISPKTINRLMDLTVEFVEHYQF